MNLEDRSDIDRWTNKQMLLDEQWYLPKKNHQAEWIYLDKRMHLDEQRQKLG